MSTSRVIPVLLLQNRGLVKSVRFKDYRYIGDPINAVKIFNEKEVDELVILDITATSERKSPDYDLIEEIVTEAFMPVCYGGGIRSSEMIRKILRLGIEKVSVNSYALENPDFIREAAGIYGSSTVIVSIDVKKDLLGNYSVYDHGSGRKIEIDPVEYAINMEKMGAGEILLTSVDHDGMMDGYDLTILNKITPKVNIPVIANGGAGSLEDFSSAVKTGGASAVSAGSFFVYYGKLRAVLINYPSRAEISRYLS